MKLGYSSPAWGAGPPADAAAGVAEADRLGLDSVWTSEAYGADSIGDKKAAIAAVPTALAEDVALVGPLPKVLEDLGRWRSTVVTTLVVKCEPGVLAQIRDQFD